MTPSEVKKVAKLIDTYDDYLQKAELCTSSNISSLKIKYYGTLYTIDAQGTSPLGFNFPELKLADGLEEVIKRALITHFQSKAASIKAEAAKYGVTFSSAKEPENES